MVFVVFQQLRNLIRGFQIVPETVQPPVFFRWQLVTNQELDRNGIGFQVLDTRADFSGNDAALFSQTVIFNFMLIQGFAELPFH